VPASAFFIASVTFAPALPVIRVSPPTESGTFTFTRTAGELWVASSIAADV